MLQIKCSVVGQSRRQRERLSLIHIYFGSRGKEHFDTLRRFAPERPVMCTEFWNGWFDHWYEQHHRRESDETAGQLEQMLRDGCLLYTS